MDKKVIDNIVWYIPIKKLRDNLRIFLLEISYKLNIIQETSNTLNISKTPEEEYLTLKKLPDDTPFETDEPVIKNPFTGETF